MTLKNAWAGLARMTGGLVLAVCVSAPAFAAVTLHVTTNDAVPGGTLTLSLASTRGEGDPATASEQLDVTFDTSQLDLLGVCSGNGPACHLNSECASGRCVLNCSKSERLTRQDFNATFPDFQDLPGSLRKVRLRVLAPITGQLPLPSFEDGPVATCQFAVNPSAGLGPVSLSANRIEVGDNEGGTIAATVEITAGSIVAALPTATATATIPPTPTNTVVVPTNTPIPATPTPTSTIAAPTRTSTVPPTQTPTAVAPTATSTTVVATRTSAPTHAPATATPTSTSRRGGGDGCNVAATRDPSGPWSLLVVPFLLIWRRRS